MKTLHFSIQIAAPREKVWKAMLEDATYREWTKAFDASSSYRGSWEEGEEIRFIGPDSDGKESGMIARIKENRPNEFISIEHIGVIENGVEDRTSEKVKKWIPAYENYTFTDKDGGTELIVDVDTADEYEEMFAGMWPKALQTLKEIAER